MYNIQQSFEHKYFMIPPYVTIISGCNNDNKELKLSLIKDLLHRSYVKNQLKAQYYIKQRKEILSNINLELM